MYMSIAFFDSGVGGLTVLKAMRQHLPHENYIYYADTQHVPYGTQPKSAVKKYIFQAVSFLAKKNIKLLVIACNTATSVAIKDLRKKYAFPIIGMEPAVKPAIKNRHHKKILVLATTLTLRGTKLNNLIKKLDRRDWVEKLALNKLVTYAEELNFNSPEVKKYLIQQLEFVTAQKYGTLVLGCTHFIFYKPLLKKILPPQIKIIDGNQGTVKHILKIMIKNNLTEKTKKTGQITFYSSGHHCCKNKTAKLKKIILNKKSVN